jgi:hypothetical protein
MYIMVYSHTLLFFLPNLDHLDHTLQKGACVLGGY